jgi:zinc/manganese transport system substrate-binding protein
MRDLIYILRLALLLSVCAQGLAGQEAQQSKTPLNVASLNPVVSDLARQVGGDDLRVIDLMPVGANPHTFYPSPADLKQAASSALVLAAGKGLETYLAEFNESLGGKVPILEVGGAVPSLSLHTDAVFVCCPDHTRHVIDPHWWHSVRNARRAAAAIARELGKLDPERADAYRQRCKQYVSRLDALHDWARRQIATIPRRDRELTTAHAAFGYLCREFGLRSITVQGLSTEEDPRPGYLKDVIKTLKDNDVRAVFPEDNANPKVVASMVRETGVKVGGALLAGTLPKDNPTYEAMVRQNITTIVESLRRKE